MELRELKSEKQLNEGFSIIGWEGKLGEARKKTIIFCNGFTVNEKYAVVRNDEAKIYTVTYIDTGMRVGSEFTRFNEVKKMYKPVIFDAERKLQKRDNGEDIVENAKKMFQKMMREYVKQHASGKAR